MPKRYLRSLGPLFTHPEAYSMSSSRYLDAMFVDAFSKGRQLLRGDPRKSIHLACGLLLRGDIVISDVARNVGKLKREIRMAHWNPDGTQSRTGMLRAAIPVSFTSNCAGFKTGICAAKPLHGPYSLLTLSNNTSVVQTLQHDYEKFMSLYRVRAHMHHYTQYMDGEMFRDAVTQVMDVISSYNESKCSLCRKRCNCDHPIACVAVESAEDTLD
jgi:tubulin epsilon